MALRRWTSAALQTRLQLLQQQSDGVCSTVPGIATLFKQKFSDSRVSDGTTTSTAQQDNSTSSTHSPLAGGWIGRAPAPAPAPESTEPSTPPPQYAGHDLPTEPFSFDGFFAVPHRRLKYISMAQAAFATAAAPLMLFMAQDGNLETTAKVASVAVTCMGWLTTCGFHWFTSPYVHRLDYDPETQLVTAYTMNIIGREQQHTFELPEVKYADTWKPLSTFQVKGRVFYLEKQRFSHKGLLAALSPPDPKAEALQQAAKAAKLQQEQE